MSQFIGKWKVVSEENLDELFEAFGMYAVYNLHVYYDTFSFGYTPLHLLKIFVCISEIKKSKEYFSLYLHLNFMYNLKIFSSCDRRLNSVILWLRI